MTQNDGEDGKQHGLLNSIDMDKLETEFYMNDSEWKTNGKFISAHQSEMENQKDIQLAFNGENEEELDEEEYNDDEQEDSDVYHGLDAAADEELKRQKT